MKVVNDILNNYYKRLEKIESEKREKEIYKQKKVESWKNQGDMIVYPDQIGPWEIYVENRARDVFDGSDVEDALSVMKALEDGVSITDALKIFSNSGNDKFYDKIIAQTVGYFSKHGVEFLRRIHTEIFNEKLDEPFLNFLKQIEQKNQNSIENLQRLNG